MQSFRSKMLYTPTVSGYRNSNKSSFRIPIHYIIQQIYGNDNRNRDFFLIIIYRTFVPKQKCQKGSVSALRCRPSFVPRQKKAKTLRSKGEMARHRYHQKQKHQRVCADLSPSPRRLTSHIWCRCTNKNPCIEMQGIKNCSISIRKTKGV